MEFEQVDEIPPREHTFTMSEETEQLIGILNGLEPGQIIRLPVTELNGREEANRESKKLQHRLQTATKHAEGYFKVSRRRFDIYVKRAE